MGIFFYILQWYQMSVFDSLAKLGVHEYEISRLFGAHSIYEGGPVFDHPLLCIGFFNRSGSNLLADYLRGTPRMAGFHEQLNFSTVKHYSAERKIRSFPDYIKSISQAAVKSGKSYGFKASYDQLMMLQRLGIHRMYTGGIRVIHITRDDLVGLAISYQIAHQTKQWTSRQTATVPVAEVRFDPHQITHLITEAQTSLNGISAFCTVFDYDRLPVTYEDLVRDPQSVLDRIAEFCGQSAGAWQPCHPTIARQSSDLNNRFREKYLQHVRDMLVPSSETVG